MAIFYAEEGYRMIAVTLDGATASVGRLDPVEFEQCFRRILPSLSRYAHSLTRDQDAAQDLVQEAALRAWQARSRFEAGSNFKAWCYCILRNCFLSGVRRQRIRRVESWGDELPDIPVAPSQELALNLKDVERNWKLLTSDQQLSLTLVAIKGHTYEEASTIEQVELGTLKSRVARGRSMLSSIVSGEITPAAARRMPLESKSSSAQLPAPDSQSNRLSRVTDRQDRFQADLLRDWRARRAAEKLAAA